jgi:hypothetical protein
MFVSIDALKESDAILHIGIFGVFSLRKDLGTGPGERGGPSEIRINY